MSFGNGSHLTQSTLKSTSGFLTLLITYSLSLTAQFTIDNASPLAPREKAQVEDLTRLWDRRKSSLRSVKKAS